MQLNLHVQLCCNVNFNDKQSTLQITEVVLGIISVVTGAATSGIVGDGPIPYQSYRYNYYSGSYYITNYAYEFTTGEGIWCGVWVSIIDQIRT